MFLKTLKSRMFHETSWLRAWPVAKKREELWNAIAGAIEDLKHHGCDPEKASLVLTRFSAGFELGPPILTAGRFAPIAAIKVWDYPAFRAIWENIESSTLKQQEDAIDPMVEDALRQVYG